MDSGGGSSGSSGREDDDQPSLRDLVEKVNERRGAESPATGGDTADRRVGEPAPGEPADPRSLAADAFEPGGPERPIESFGADPRTEAIIEVLGDTATLLLLGPLLTPADYDLCTRLTTALPDDGSNLLLVTLTESPDERLAIFQGYLDQLPETTTVLNVGDSTRTRTRETVAVDDAGPVTITTISDPADLMRIGITISRIISDWAEDGEDAVVCFHSLTALLQFATDPKTVFRFLHVLRGRLKAAGAHAHFHMDPEAHDDQTVETFRSLFDEVLRFEEDGTLSVDH